MGYGTLPVPDIGDQGHLDSGCVTKGLSESDLSGVESPDKQGILEIGGISGIKSLLRQNRKITEVFYHTR